MDEHYDFKSASMSLYLLDSIQYFIFFPLASVLDSIMLERQQNKPESQVINVSQVSIYN